MDDLEKELKQTFLDEAEQLLSDCEQCFLNLDENPNDPAVIEKIFRLAHSFKGSAGAVGFDDLTMFAHHLETLLNLVKEHVIGVTNEVVSLLLRANDRLNEMVSALRLNPDQKFSNEKQIAEIEAIISNKNVAELNRNKPQEEAVIFSHLEDDGGPQEDFAIFSEKKNIPSQQHAAQQGNIRVSLQRIDNLVNDVGELVILQTVLFQHRHSIPSSLLQKTIAHLEKITRQIQSTSMSLRMVPIKPTFQKMQRIVRDSAQSLGKQIVFSTTGEDTEIDKTILDVLSDPLVHLIRNASDHGVEMPEERAEAGKPRQGHVTLRAYYQGEHIIIEVRDDGRGLNPEKLVEKAIKKGLIKAGSRLSENEAFQLIFMPGFSTKDEVTALSGRGVGMDVVKTHVEQIQGRIEIDSQLGKGTCFRVLLPLTLAIIDGMVVKAGLNRYVIPISSIIESLQPKKEDISHVTGRGTYLNVRGETIPLFRLADVLGYKLAKADHASQIAVVGRGAGDQLIAMLVDDILGQQQIVIKRLGDELQGIKGISGAAILGDGVAALIVDISALIETRTYSPDRHIKKREAA